MKLAEALQERADLNRRIQQLQQRLNSNAIVQEGGRPAEAVGPRRGPVCVKSHPKMR